MKIVNEAFFKLGDTFKKSLLNVPARVTAEVRAAQNEVTAQSIITKEITQILNQFFGLLPDFK